jgi:sn-glycerol 3-phosphate transport system substrate-binding protein
MSETNKSNIARLMRSLAMGLGVSALAMGAAMPAFAQERVQVEWWFALGGRLEELVQKLVTDFNASQDQYEVVAVHKGNYEQTMAAMVAAYRVNQQPAIMQAAERGFLTMLNSGAIVPVDELMEEQGYDVDWVNFVAPVAGFYMVDGKAAAMPFNSSSPIFWYNADHFEAAGFDSPGETWQEVEAQLVAIKEQGISDCAMALPNDFFWSLIENYSAIHDVPFATMANGYGGLGTEFIYNQSDLVVGQVERLKRLMDADVLQLAGQGMSPEQLFTSGACSTIAASTAAHAGVEAGAQFDWNATFLPHEEGVEPLNSTIGGAALWVLQGKSDEEYAGVAAFLDFVASPETQEWWAEVTGYVPITNAAYDVMKSSGYFDDHPTREIAILQLNRTEPTDNSRGFRFGNHNQTTQILVEELQGVWAGQQSPQEALDKAVARGNEVLRQYEQLNDN